jgi:hypothetical protein
MLIECSQLVVNIKFYCFMPTNIFLKAHLSEVALTVALQLIYVFVPASYLARTLLSGHIKRCGSSCHAYMLFDV